MYDKDRWLMRIEGALSAHFFQPDGSSKPGTDWSVGLLFDQRQEHVVKVRTYLSDDITTRASKDTEYQGGTVLGYISDLLESGWTPEQGGELEITIQNPTGEPTNETGSADKPWWKVW